MASTLKFNNGATATGGLSLSFARDQATVDPRGNAVAVDTPRYHREVAIADRVTWTTGSITANTGLLGAGTRSDGTPCLFFRPTGNASLTMQAGSLDSLSTVRDISIVGGDNSRWSPTGSPANTGYVPQAIVCHYGAIVIKCARYVSNTLVGVSILVSLDELQTFTIQDLAVNAEASGGDSGMGRGREWAMQNAFPYPGRGWATGFMVPFADYLYKASNPKGGQVGLIGLTRASSGDSWTVGTLRKIYDRWEASDSGGLHCHGAAVTTGGIVSAWGDVYYRNSILFHPLDLSDYVNNSVGTMVTSFGGFTTTSTTNISSPQPVALAPGSTAGSFIGACDEEGDVIQKFGAMVDGTDFTCDSLMSFKRTLGGNSLQGWAPLQLHHSPLNGFYAHGGRSESLYNVSRNGSDFAFIASPASLATLWVYGSYLFASRDDGTTYYAPMPSISVVKPLAVNPGGTNPLDGTFDINSISPSTGITRRQVYLDSGTWRYVDDDSALAVQPPLATPFDSSILGIWEFRGDGTPTDRNLGRYYMTTDDASHGVRADLMYLCNLAKQGAEFHWRRYRTVPSDSTATRGQQQGTFNVWKPFAFSLDDAGSSEDDSRVRYQMYNHSSSNEESPDAAYLVAFVNCTDRNHTSYPVPYEITGPDELATVTGLSLAGNSFAMALTTVLPDDASYQTHDMPIATLWADANNYVYIWIDDMDSVIADFYVGGSSVGSLTFLSDQGINPATPIDIVLTCDGTDFAGSCVAGIGKLVTDSDTLSGASSATFTELRVANPDQTEIGSIGIAGLYAIGTPTSPPVDWFSASGDTLLRSPLRS